MWCVGSNSKEEWLAGCSRVIQESVCLRSKDIGRVFAYVIDGWVVVALKAAVQVLVCERVKEEIRSSEAGGVGFIVVLYCVKIE